MCVSQRHPVVTNMELPFINAIPYGTYLYRYGVSMELMDLLFPRK